MAATSPPGAQQQQNYQRQHGSTANSHMFLNAMAELPPVAHQRAAKSCDFDMLAGNNNNNQIMSPTQINPYQQQQQSEYFGQQQNVAAPINEYVQLFFSCYSLGYSSYIRYKEHIAIGWRKERRYGWRGHDIREEGRTEP